MHMQARACLARICWHAYAMHAYLDVDMQTHIFMQMDAYACICTHIPLAGEAHPGGPYPLGGGGGDREPWTPGHM